VPRTIRTVVRCCSSAERLCSAITLECELFSMMEPMIHPSQSQMHKISGISTVAIRERNISKGQQQSITDRLRQSRGIIKVRRMGIRTPTAIDEIINPRLNTSFPQSRQGRGPDPWTGR